MWYAQYLAKYGNKKQKKYAQNKERGVPAKEILPGYSRVTPDIMRLLSKPVGEFTENEYSKFRNMYDDAKSEWETRREEEEAKMREREKVTTPLTYEQKNFIMSNKNIIRDMAKRALREQIYKGKINPNFGLDEDFKINEEILEDFAQEALIKMMEIIPEKWGKIKDKHWPKYIHTTLRSMAETFMRSVYPSITQDYWQNRQYLPVPVAQYSYKMKNRQKLIKFLDDKIVEEFGQQVFFRATPQDMGEIITYLMDKYRGNLFAIMEDLDIDPVYFRKELSRYKEMRVANAGGRTQVENREPEEITEEEIEKAEFMMENPRYLFQEMQDEDTSKIIINFLNKSPEPVRLMVSLIYGIDFNKLGLNADEISSKLGMPFENFVDEMYKNTNNEIKWSRFKKIILNTYGEIYGFLKRRYSIHDFNEALLERFKEYIEEEKYMGEIDERYYPVNLQASRNFYSKKYIKLAQNNEELNLTQSQEKFINKKIIPILRQYIREILVTKAEEGLVNPSFVINEDLIEDLVQEAVIISMEILSNWEESEKEFWKYFFSSVDHLIYKATISQIPKTKKEHFIRQYAPVRQPYYDYPLPITMNFLDDKLKKEFGHSIFQSDSETMEEAVDYIISKYTKLLFKKLKQKEEELIKNGEIEKEMGLERMNKELYRYKAMRILLAGGRPFVESLDYSDLDNLNISNEEEDLILQMEMGKLPDNLIDKLVEAPLPIRLVAFLLYDINPARLNIDKKILLKISRKLGLSYKQFLDGLNFTKGESPSGRGKWGDIKSLILSIFGPIEGLLTKSTSVKDFNRKLLQYI